MPPRLVDSRSIRHVMEFIPNHADLKQRHRMRLSNYIRGGGGNLRRGLASRRAVRLPTALAKGGVYGRLV